MMNKGWKKLGLLSLTATMLWGIGAPSVQAQDELENRVIKTSLQSKSVHTKIKVSMTYSDLEENHTQTVLKSEVDASLDLDKMTGKAVISLDKFAGASKVKLALVDGYLYGKADGKELDRIDLKSQVLSWKSDLENLRQVETWIRPQDTWELAKYFKSVKEDWGYLLLLSEAIDGKQLYRDHQEFWDQVKQELLHQVLLETSNPTIYDQNARLIDYILNEEAFGAFMAREPEILVRTDKDFRVTHVTVDFQFSIDQEMELFSGLTGIFHVKLEADLDQYDQAVSVEKP
ncbi:hypothetical protein MK526_06405 [Abiotrophia defectiva]|uniref:hypothetical protein n=1 Tax=Abiotrophia defectiva TaxID=46125 RepID=UPI002280A6DF|nr:hypothetical protein [Abiotrophia defectiva]MCY7225377.1 hypothetical protein [Abiotrophia defectiva]